MNIIKFKQVKIETPEFDPNPHKSTTNNHSWRQCLIVLFEDSFGEEYSYMPKWSELRNIWESAQVTEDINKEIYSHIKQKESEKK